MMINSSYFLIKPPQEIVFEPKVLEQFTDKAAILRNGEKKEGQAVKKCDNSKKNQGKQEERRKMRLEY